MTLNFPTGILFSDPRTNQRLAGAQLSFFISGTSTPTPVYSDAALTSTIVQPVVADANGNFQSVYLDPFANGGVIKIQQANSVAVVQRITDPYYIPLAITPDSLNLQYHDGVFEVTIPMPPANVPALVVNNLPGSVAVRIIGGGIVAGGSLQPAWEVNNITTGVTNASFTSVANKPGFNISSPVKWLPILSGGVTYFVPCFL